MTFNALPPEEAARAGPCYDCGFLAQPHLATGNIEDDLDRVVFLCPDCSRPTCWACATARHQRDGNVPCGMPAAGLRYEPVTGIRTCVPRLEDVITSMTPQELTDQFDAVVLAFHGASS